MIVIRAPHNTITYESGNSDEARKIEFKLVKITGGGELREWEGRNRKKRRAGGGE